MDYLLLIEEFDPEAEEIHVATLLTSRCPLLILVGHLGPPS